jgi:DNA-binding protein HU-beta
MFKGVKTMTKLDLITKIAEKTNNTKINTEFMLDAFIDTMVESLKSGEKVSLAGLGNLNVVERKARKGRNLNTGKEVLIPARKVITFSTTKALKEEMNKKAKKKKK